MRQLLPKSSNSPDVGNGLHRHLGGLLEGGLLDGGVEHHEPELEQHPQTEGRQEDQGDQPQPPVVDDGEDAGQDEDTDTRHHLAYLASGGGADSLK